MSRPRLVILGMMTKMPVPGVVWQTVQYMIGFERLGYETYYVEAHGRTPSMFMVSEEDAAPRASAFLADVLGRFGFGGRWAFHCLHSDGRCYGIELTELTRLYRSAALLVNLHGGTIPLPEHAQTGRLVLLETDPVATQIELHEGNETTAEFLRCHAALFTYAEAYGAPGCGLPRSKEFEFLPTRQPVVMELWQPTTDPGRLFTTVANWRQQWRTVSLDGEQYLWSKHHEFLRFLDLPLRTDQQFELALSGHTEEDRALLQHNGWRVRSALDLTLDGYRDFLFGSRAEFTVAKDQNIRLRTGWFSDRIPTGTGLLAYTDIDELADSVERVAKEPRRHGLAARDLAREHFDHNHVLGSLLETMGLSRPALSHQASRGVVPQRPIARLPFPADLDLEPVRRNPTVLSQSTVDVITSRSITPFRGGEHGRLPHTSIVVLTRDNVVFTRLCLESVLALPDADDIEVVVVDNGSADETVEWLEQLAATDSRVNVVANINNLGFARGVNQGLARAVGRVLVLLNNDTIPTPGWLTALDSHIHQEEVGMVGPMTGRGGGACNVPVRYRTYGEMLAEARDLVAGRSGAGRRVDMLTMFCVAMRRDVYESVGPLDERFEVGLFEDDDYCLRVRAAGYELRCAEDAFVHHFGRATFDHLVTGGEYAQRFETNRLLFEKKWGGAGRYPRAAPSADYMAMVHRLRRLVDSVVPDHSSVAVISRGDEEMVSLGRGRRGIHFPSGPDGHYAGHYPADSAEALHLLEMSMGRGASYLVVPHTAAWWLRHYGGLAEHLARRAAVVAWKADTGTVYHLANHDETPARLETS